MHGEEWHRKNLQALSAQEDAPVGHVSIESVATMLAVRDELIHDLKRVIEDDVRARLRERRVSAIAIARDRVAE